METPWAKYRHNKNRRADETAASQEVLRQIQIAKPAHWPGCWRNHHSCAVGILEEIVELLNGGGS